MDVEAKALHYWALRTVFILLLFWKSRLRVVKIYHWLSVYSWVCWVFSLSASLIMYVSVSYFLYIFL